MTNTTEIPVYYQNIIEIDLSFDIAGVASSILATRCAQLPRIANIIFPTTANAIKLAWARATRRVGIDDLHFHDLRLEAVSRLFELGLSMPEVAAISGHRDPRMLFRYTHLNVQDLAMKLAALGSNCSE